ncbi:BICD family-like cargo adapter 1 [Takifugu rubripes]|uniref:Si:ch211-235m3.5 n=1 Tax=Takifugu rubripes TaxID=31033 RepID=H2URP7_TAKRU|nr:BICD family-like cargo adapter 1 [Takifugu rubripes]|eukprot:XP_011606732.1 PREDICTED: bicaudal D-related protein 1-like [Takifugu rubripes]
MDRLDAWSLKSRSLDLGKNFYFEYGAEEITDYRDPGELLAALKQKEEEVILAAQLGNALLLENQQLKDQSDKLHEQYADTLEDLEQSKHDLRLKLEGCQSQWESQVSDLERDARELSAQVESLTGALAEAERDKVQAQRERDEQTQRLREQLDTAVEVERAMSNELQALKQELQRNGGYNRLQDEELISAMREQVLRLTQKERLLEERLESTCQENTELRANLASLQARLARHDQLNQQHTQQLAQAWQEVEVAKSRSQQLQNQVEDLQEKVSLQEAGSHGDVSLLSELEISLAAADMGVSKEEMKQELESILQLLLPLAPDPSNSERSDGEDHQEDLRVMLQQLKGVAQTFAQTAQTQGLNQAFVDHTGDHCGTLRAAQELRDQNILLQQENTELRNDLVSSQEKAEVVKQAIRDRDEAIAKKNLIEAELVRSKNDMMSLNNQLLEAIQRKLELSQELEAWQDDIQIILNQQLRSQQQSELPQKKSTPNGLSFFRRSSRTASAGTRQASCSSSSFSWSSDTHPDKSQSPWKDWLRRGKVAQYGK